MTSLTKNPALGGINEVFEFLLVTRLIGSNLSYIMSGFNTGVIFLYHFHTYFSRSFSSYLLLTDIL